MGLAELKAAAIPLGCKTVDVWPTGVGESHHLRTLVEGFARSIVDGLTQNLHIIRTLHQYDLCVPSRHEQTYIWEGRHLIILFLFDEMRQHMPMEMIHIYQGDVQTDRHTLGEGCADMERTE